MKTEEGSAQSGAEAGLQVFSLVRGMIESFADRGIEVSTETRSMVPLLEGAERVFWRRPDPPPRPGDVLIYYQRPGGVAPDAGMADVLARSLVVHRLIRRRRDGTLRTKGDGRPQMDVQDVAPVAVLGVVTAIQRGPERILLDGASARVYGQFVRWVSWAGSGSYRIAVLTDAALRRIIPGLGDRRVVRAPAWWCQKLAIAGVHRLLAAACLRRRRNGRSSGRG